MKSRMRIPLVASSTDPRIDNIVSVFKGWRDAYKSEQVEMFMKQLFECVDWRQSSLDDLRRAVVAIAGDSNDLLDIMNAEANDERVLQLQSEHGGEIAEVLARTGIGAYQAEKLAHEAIATAVLLTRQGADRGNRDAG